MDSHPDCYVVRTLREVTKMPSYNYVVRPRARANPPPLKPEDVEYARFEWWSRDYPFKTADEWIRPFLAAERTTWLRTAREALLLSSAKVAESLGTSRENYLKLERAEPAGQVSLKHLSEAAEAMGCE